MQDLHSSTGWLILTIITVESRFLEPSVSRTFRYLEPNFVFLGFASLKLYNFTPKLPNNFWLAWGKLTPEGDSRMKQTGMLVVPPRGVNFGFCSRLGCSGQSADILYRQGLVQGSAKKRRIARKETEVKFSFQIKAFDDFVVISLKLIACRIFVFLNGLFA